MCVFFLGFLVISDFSKQKSKDFFEQVTNIENVSPKIKLEVQRRLRSEFGE